MIEKIEKHFNKHDCLPKIDKDNLLLYMMQFCPFSRRVTLTMSYHDIIHDRIFIDITCKPFWLMKLNPKGQVPILELNNEILTESELICQFLDRINLRRTLFKECKTDALKEVNSWFNKMIEAHRSIAWGKQFTEQHKVAYLKAFEDFKNLSGESFIGGNDVGIGDFILYPVIEMSPLCFQRLRKHHPLETDRYERLYNWMQAMKRLDAVRKEAICIGLHEEYVEKFLGLDYVSK